VSYRASSNGVPTGPPNLTQAYEVCRTIHGPVVARDDSAGLARSVQYAMFGHELDTIEGVREWNRAHSIDAFIAGVRKVTWNENATVATSRGDIGYFHPGLFPRRAAGGDMRLPLPGTGDYDFGAPLPFDDLPHVINPAQGYLANWNTKPALGWLDGEGYGSTSRAGGPGQRVTSIMEKIAKRDDWRFEDLRAIDRQAGTNDPRAREYLPVIEMFRGTAASRMSGVQREALDRVLAWDRQHYGAGIDPADDTTWFDSTGATIFGEYVTALRDELFGGLKDNVLDAAGTGTTCGVLDKPEMTIYGRMAGVGSHRFDQSVMDNVAIRILDPSRAGLALRHDFTGGRPRDDVMLAALNVAMQRLADQYNGGNAMTQADLAKARRAHPPSRIPSLSEAIGPGSDSVPGPNSGCVLMPYQDRGSWIHRVGWEQK
jgi:acyl-homoserine lactone acylase PvdQ